MCHVEKNSNTLRYLSFIIFVNLLFKGSAYRLIVSWCRFVFLYAIVNCNKVITVMHRSFFMNFLYLKAIFTIIVMQ